MGMTPFPSSMALLLHIETATSSSSVAISDNGKLLALAERNEKNIHASVITELITEAATLAGVALNELNAISVSMGPGSYTGLRIGVATAKGLCYGLEIPLIGINTLQVMSLGMLDKLKSTDPILIIESFFTVCPLIDARRMEVYTARYNQSGELTSDTSALIIDENTFSEELAIKPMVFFGDGSDKIKELYVSSKNACFVPDFLNSATFQIIPATAAFNLSNFEDLRSFEPFYLKEFFTTQEQLKPKQN